MGAIEQLVARDRAITLAGLVLLWALAFFYIWVGAGMGMTARDMTTLALFPHQQSADMAMTGMTGMGMDANPAITFVLVNWVIPIFMWWVMMIAMMVPSAAPTILLYSRVHGQAVARGRSAGRLAPTGAFGAGYLLIWLAFSLAAAALHLALDRWDIASAMGSQNRWFSAAVLLAAGVYQFSPLKTACLSHCRSPGEFLSRHWRPGWGGALRLGVIHGAYCAGCCWVLMALLFVGGAMNLAWIAALALLVLAEKLLPRGPWIGRCAGLALVLWSIATILV